ncbi:2-hydroxy-3-oxopropionate reductase [Halomonas sp. NYA30]
MLNIGFIGLGLMGQGMATNLIKHNFPLTIMAHRNRAPIEALCQLGANEAGTPAEVASRSDLVFVCVSTSEQMENITLGTEGLLAGANPGLIIVDCSTSLPQSTQRLSASIEAAGCHLLRTPKEAREGRLNVMVGGSQKIVDQAWPAIEAFAENIFHVGELGSAHKLKLINNYLSLSAAALAAEAAAMAANMEVDQHKLYEVCSQGGANSAMFNAVMPWVLEADETRLRFSLGNAGKDMGYLSETIVLVK